MVSNSSRVEKRGSFFVKEIKIAQKTMIFLD